VSAQLPHVQVFVFRPELTCSVWEDLYSRRRTKKSLEAMLRKGVRSGHWIGYRFVTIHEQHIGVDWRTPAGKAAR
jgi:hypothetical protein